MNFIKILSKKDEKLVKIYPSRIKIMQNEIYNRNVVKFVNSYL